MSRLLGVRHRWVAVVAVLAMGVALGSPIIVSERGGRGAAKGGPDGVGGIPRTTGPTSPSSPNTPWTADIYLPTPALVCDAVTREPIVGALVVVTLPGEGLVAQGVTNEAGAVTLMLQDLPGHELALPTLGVAGVGIDPGEAVLILVP